MVEFNYHLENERSSVCGCLWWRWLTVLSKALKPLLSLKIKLLFFFLTNHTHKTIVCVLLVNEKLWVWLPLCKQTYFLSPDLVKPLTATVFQFGFCVSCDARQFHMANASMTALSFMSRMYFPKCHLKMILVDGVNTLFFSPITPSC